MSRLQREIEIANKMDEIKAKLHQNVVDIEDTIWLIKTVNQLLIQLHIVRQQDYDEFYEDYQEEMKQMRNKS